MNDAIKEKLSNVLEIPGNVESIQDLCYQDLAIIKGINEKKASILKNILHISTIDDFAVKKITEDNYRVLESLGIDTFNLNIWFFISKVIAENRIEEFFGPQKISIVGLNYAGKTAISKIMKQKLNLDLYIHDTPTRGVKYEMLRHQIFNKVGLQYIIVDMGGQDQYRKEYIQNAEKYFANISLLFFVIDVQDPGKFDKALEYLQDVLKILKLLNENPEFLIIINKVDPDIRNNKDVIDSILLLRLRINNLFKEQGNNFKYEIVSYSIFDFLGDNKTIINEIRNFTARDSSPPQTDVSTEKSYRKILDMFIELRAEVGDMLLNIDKKIEKHGELIENNRNLIEELKKSYATPATTLTTNVNVPPPKIELISDKINKELKKLIKKRRT